jgi:hypothetical protein
LSYSGKMIAKRKLLKQQTFLILAVAVFVLLRHIQTIGLTVYNVYFERDAYRASQIFAGHMVYFGSELWAGGNTPGSFLYILNLIPLAIHNHPVAILYFTYFMFSLAVIAMFIGLRRYFGSNVAFFAALFLAVNNRLFLDIKMAWNPTESFFLYVVWVVLVFRIVTDRKGVVPFYLAAALISLLGQIHLSYMLHIVSLFLLVRWFRRDIGKRGLIMGGIFFIIPIMPYAIMMATTDNPLIESIFSKSYTAYNTYYEQQGVLVPLQQVWNVIKVMFWYRPGGMVGNHAQSFLSTLAPPLPTVEKLDFVLFVKTYYWMIHGIYQSHGLTSALSLLGGWFVVANTFLLRFFIVIGLAALLLNWKNGLNRVTLLRRLSVIFSGSAITPRYGTLLVLILTPLILFYPFLGGEALERIPFHYFHILIVPSCIMFGVVVGHYWSPTPISSRTASSAISKWGGSLFRFTVSVFILSALFGIASKHDDELSYLTKHMISYQEAFALSRRIIEKVDLPPEKFGQKVWFTNNGATMKFPYLYEREYILHSKSALSNRPRLDDPWSGLVIARDERMVERFRMIPELQVAWSIVEGDFTIFEYSIKTLSGFRHSAFSNFTNPYIISEENKKLLEPPEELFWRGSYENTGKPVAFPLIKLKVAEVDLRAGLLLTMGRKSLEVDYITARINSPSLTGFSSESGMSIHLERPHLVLEGRSGKQVTLPFFSSSLGKPVLGIYSNFFNTPFTAYLEYTAMDINKIHFVADSAINKRTGAKSSNVNKLVWSRHHSGGGQ